ncbi:MAG: hypothetical protein EOO06_00290 [Chitinophagaceae bacterium]|nr:MAG: hypothetical protein EOO06_00290 [Chitinophagaceae bacterium]
MFKWFTKKKDVPVGLPEKKKKVFIKIGKYRTTKNRLFLIGLREIYSFISNENLDGLIEVKCKIHSGFSIHLKGRINSVIGFIEVSQLVNLTVYQSEFTQFNKELVRFFKANGYSVGCGFITKTTNQ